MEQQSAAAKANEGTAPSSPETHDDEMLQSFCDLPIEASVQLDRKLISLREVLDLRIDSVIKMERSAGENVDLLLDGVVMGNGEIVVIEDMMGLRLTDLGLSPVPTKQRHG